MLPIILDAASVAFRLFNIAYVLTHWKERSQQKSKKALPTLAARSAEPFCLLCKNAVPGTSGGLCEKTHTLPRIRVLHWRPEQLFWPPLKIVWTSPQEMVKLLLATGEPLK